MFSDQKFVSISNFYTSYRSTASRPTSFNNYSNGVRFPTRARNFSLRHRVQNGFGAHPASYLMGTRGSFTGGKAAGVWSWTLTCL